MRCNEQSEERTVVQTGSDMYFGASWLPRRCIDASWVLVPRATKRPAPGTTVPSCGGRKSTVPRGGVLIRGLVNTTLFCHVGCPSTRGREDPPRVLKLEASAPASTTTRQHPKEDTSKDEERLTSNCRDIADVQAQTEVDNHTHARSHNHALHTVSG